MKKLCTPIALVLALMFSVAAFAVPKLNSLPGAASVIFLDFDGHLVNSSVWNNGAPLSCAPAAMTATQITEAFNRTAEDYRPFDINITTDSTVFLAAQLNKRMRIIITPTSAWYPGVGGVAYIGSFAWGDDTPGFVFSDRLGPNSPKMVGECCSHESGHTVGLSHQSKYGADCNTPIEQYNSGTGTGEPSWAPIMGNSYYKNMSNWNNGPTPYGCTNVQDNLSLISTLNGFGYRADDFSEVMNGTTTNLGSSNFTKEGIISTNTDKDVFKISVSQTGALHLTATPFNVAANNGGANLDIKLEIYNTAGTLINTYNPVQSMGITIDTVLNSGTYFIKIDGSGNVNVGEYGSLGSYTLSGVTGALPIHDVTLTGNIKNGKHNLGWNIVADEPVKTIAIEKSTDGIHYTALTATAGTSKNFTYTPFENSVLYYRLKVTSVLDQSMYSNAISLKSAGENDNKFKVSSFINSEITVNAAVPYLYQLLDINGRVIAAGNGATGINNVNINNQPKGMYIIQLISNNKRQTERIIKQ